MSLPSPPTEPILAHGLITSSSDCIKSIETFYVRPRWLFVRVETQRGIVGWGEATLEGHSEAVEGAFVDLRERFVGWDCANIEDIWQSAYRHRFYRGGCQAQSRPGELVEEPYLAWTGWRHS